MTDHTNPAIPDPFQSSDRDTFRDAVVSDPLRAADEMVRLQRALYRVALLVNEDLEGVVLDHDLGLAFLPPERDTGSNRETE